MGAGRTKARSRRTLWLLVVTALVAISALVASGTTPAVAAPDAPSCATGVDFLGFSDDLDKQPYEGTSVGGLSALTYDVSRDVYYGLVDNGPDAAAQARFYTLYLPLDGGWLGTPEVLGVTALRDATGQPFTAANFDGEGIALTHQGELLISSETEPSIRRFALDGRLLEELPVPPKFLVAPDGEATSNQTFESLALSPNEHSLFTAVEGPLASDETTESENRLRILRYEDRGPGGFRPAEEFFYLTEPGQGVVEIVALSEDELLVLERGFVPGEGNTVRIFRVSLAVAGDVSGEPSLAAPGLAPVEKELLVDLAHCPPSGATSPGTQANPLLDNFEGLALGPRLPGGRQALLLQSDDNFSSGQVTREISLAARLQPSKSGNEPGKQPTEDGE